MYTIRAYKNKSRIDGYGLFAGEFVPKGTIVYYCGSDNIGLSKKEFILLPKEKQELYYRYGVEDEAGNWFLTNGDANHSCDANILSLFVDSLYCDIAVKDIRDINGRILNMKKNLEFYQYRELFVQEYNRPLSFKESYYLQNVPLINNNISKYTGDQKYWMNTPVQ